MGPKTNKPSETPWSSVAKRRSDSMWEYLSAMRPEDLRMLVAGAVEKARPALESHRDTFDDRVSKRPALLAAFGHRADIESDV